MVATSWASAFIRTSGYNFKQRRATRRAAHGRRPHRFADRFLEYLEDRTLLSALFVTSPSTPTDATHFQTLQDALAVASPGDTIRLQAGFSTGTVLSALPINKAITLTSDPGVVVPYSLRVSANGVTLSGLTMAAGTNLLLDGSNTIIINCTLPKVTIDSGSGHNTFTGDAIAGLSTIGGGNANGHDVFNGNTFTGKVAVTGNDSVETVDSFSGNTFTSSATYALDLEHASGTTVQNNTFSDTAAAANVIMVHNSDTVLIVGNQITANGGGAHGIYVFSDGTGGSAADIRSNTITTTDGVAVYLSKMSASGTLEVRVQGNNLEGNGVGVYVFGDGSSGGNIDLGGGTTKFGAGTGGNDFSGFTSADGSHFAVGLFATASDYTVHADGNTWGVNDPLSVVADTTHTLDASGSGQVTAASPIIILPAPPPPPPPPPNPDPSPTPTPTETITETLRNLTVVQGSHTCGPIAHFTDTVKHKPGDFTVTITWADGSTSQGFVWRDHDGYDVFASHAWNATGSFSYTVSVTSSGATASAQGTVTVNPRVLKATGVNGTANAGVNFCGTVATFTDNLCAGPCDYLVTIAWSDGTTSRGMVVRNCNGTYCVKASRTFATPGTITGTVTVATRDGLFSATAGFSLTINPPPPPPPPPAPAGTRHDPHAATTGSHH